MLLVTLLLTAVSSGLAMLALPRNRHDHHRPALWLCSLVVALLALAPLRGQTGLFPALATVALLWGLWIPIWAGLRFAASGSRAG